MGGFRRNRGEHSIRTSRTCFGKTDVNIRSGVSLRRYKRRRLLDVDCMGCQNGQGALRRNTEVISPTQTKHWPLSTWPFDGKQNNSSSLLIQTYRCRIEGKLFKRKRREFDHRTLVSFKQESDWDKCFLGYQELLLQTTNKSEVRLLLPMLRLDSIYLSDCFSGK